MPVETKMTGRQFAGAAVMGMHFPPVRALRITLRRRNIFAKSDQQHGNSTGSNGLF